MNRKQRRAVARSAIKGKGGRKMIADSLKGVCDTCLAQKHELCPGCRCTDRVHKVKETEIGTDDANKYSKTESGLLVVRHQLGGGPRVGPR